MRADERHPLETGGDLSVDEFVCLMSQLMLIEMTRALAAQHHQSAAASSETCESSIMSPPGEELFT